jgi:hypothetical protein
LSAIGIVVGDGAEEKVGTATGPGFCAHPEAAITPTVVHRTAAHRTYGEAGGRAAPIDARRAGRGADL